MIRIPSSDRVAATERVFSVGELSKRLNVSTKTISRWRRHGLVSFRFVSDGRRRVGFRESSVDRFVRQNPKRIRRGAEFSRLSDGQRQRIVDMARRLADAGESPTEVTRRLAGESGRSDETIRCILRHFDRDHPEAAVFPDHHGVVRDETKRNIFRQYRQGESVEVLARRFCRSRASVRRTVAEMRARRIMELPLDYIPSDEFARVRSEKAVLAPMPPDDEPSGKVRRPAGLPPYLASLYEVPLLTRRQEVHLFRKMNYLKYKANKLLAQLDPTHPGTRLMERIERLYDESVATKNEIIRANLRLVVSIAKRHASPWENLFELISDGNMTLIRAVEKFDYGRGNKFGTYATWAVMRNFSRSVPDELRRRSRFRTGQDELLLSTEDGRSDEDEQELAQLHREDQVKSILGRLSGRERSVVVRRFGLSPGQAPLTLTQVGAMLGVTKERARQIESRAIGKLREAAREEGIRFSGIA